MARSSVTCDCCGSSDFEVIYDSIGTEAEPLKTETYQCTSVDTRFRDRLVKCQSCGLVFISPRVSAEDLYELAQTFSDEVYFDEKRGRFKTYELALQSLQSHLKLGAPIKHVDFSCYSGFFVECAQAASPSKSWQSYGIDVCSKIVEASNARFSDRRLFSGMVKDWPKILSSTGPFDLVTSWDALEHIPSPTEYLEVSREVLKPGGTLVLSTMDYGSVFATVTGKRWPWLMPMHLYYFTRATMETLLRKTGFKVLHWSTYPHIVSAGYLMYKLNPAFLGKTRSWPIMKDLFIKVDLRDFMTVYAQKIS